MAREAVHRKTLVFTVAKVGEEQTAPKWQEAIVPNATCPDCLSLMTVIISGGDEKFLYAHCQRCQKYYIG